MRLSGFLLALVLVMTGAGCGRRASPPPADPAPFEAAITEYLARQQFGMKITRLERVDQKDETATVTAKLQEAEGTYGLAVTWEFELVRGDDGWRVTQHRTR